VASAAQWVSAARPRTLPAAVAPVLVGAGAGAATLSAADQVWAASSWLKAALAMIVALALQVGVNYANDYSDGVRGTDGEHRVGPFRLVGSKAAAPRTVKFAAFACFGVAAVAGLVLALLTAWWLILAGVACIAAAWFYTGGKHPYGYAGLGEVFVFVFFGLIAVTGTTFVLAEGVSAIAVILAVGTGLIACAILVVNNLRDVDTDGRTGKRTLAVLLGARRTRALYAAMLVAAFVAVAVAGLWQPWCLLALAALPLAAAPVRTVLGHRGLPGGATGPALIPVLGATGLLEVGYATLLLAGLLIGR
jgi:1,4-dihydroxy-2-naphthoate octaprenyltransferase